MAVEGYVIIEKIIEDSCEQTMEFVSKNEKDKPCQTDLPLLKTISHDFYERDICIFIAEIKSVDNKKAGPFLTLPV